jgi:hypothetical protein
MLCSCLVLNLSISLFLVMKLPLYPLRFARAAGLLVIGVCLAPTRASAECGDYLTIHAPGPGIRNTPAKTDLPSHPVPNDLAQLLDKTTPQKTPCHGPNCSRGPAHDVPPITSSSSVNSQVKEMAQFLADPSEIVDLGTPTHAHHTLSRPISRSIAVFHPPRQG